jgi:ribonuclease R
MRERLGEEFGGTVSAVTSFGLFVTLDALYVEGLVHITELGGEYYRYDDARQELRGERTGIRYSVGTRVRVQVSRVDLDGRKIDFRLVREGEADRPLPRTAPAKGGEKVDSAAAELAAVKQADRVARGAMRAAQAAKAGQGGHAGHAGQKPAAGGSAGAGRAARSRKPGPQRPAPKPRNRR